MVYSRKNGVQQENNWIDMSPYILMWQVYLFCVLFLIVRTKGLVWLLGQVSANWDKTTSTLTFSGPEVTKLLQYLPYNTFYTSQNFRQTDPSLPFQAAAASMVAGVSRFEINFSDLRMVSSYIKLNLFFVDSLHLSGQFPCLQGPDRRQVQRCTGHCGQGLRVRGD